MARSSQTEWLFPQSPVGAADISGAESRLGVTLPTDLRERILRTNGARPRPGVFDLPGEPGQVFESLLSFSEVDKDYVLTVYEDVRKLLPNGAIPFARDPFGNLFCLSYQRPGDSQPSVVFWDHERSESPPGGSVRHICDTFSHFLQMLHGG